MHSTTDADEGTLDLPRTSEVSSSKFPQGASEMDTCPNCEFGAVIPYTPSVNAIELLQLGASSHDACHASLSDDIANLEEELQTIESLFIQIRDRRDRIRKDLGYCKALLAPIRRLPRELLLEIFDFASSDVPEPRHAPWILGQYPPGFLEQYASLSRDLPMHVSIKYMDSETMYALSGVVLHPERWSTLELHTNAEELSELLWLASKSSPAIQLTNLRINLSYTIQPPVYATVSHKLFSSSPIQDATFQDILYQCMPINLTELHKFHVYSYDPAELHNMLQHAQCLTEFTITPAPCPHDFAGPISYPHITHTSLQWLAFVISGPDTYHFDKVSVTFDYVTLPALQEFNILRPEHWMFFPITFKAVEYSRLINLFQRSECNLTIITLSIPVSVELFLDPILMQSPALQKLDLIIDTATARDTFKALEFERGKARHLRELCIREVEIEMGNISLMKEAVGFHAMVLSRLNSNSHLAKLRLLLPEFHWDMHQASSVPKNSSFHNFFRIKNQGIYTEFLLDREDCLVDRDTHVHIFGSS
ncbi:uncharacterized protein BT62DRAFT_1046350 [Guyanagaster necrorhizus]|uniref:Uncharacterized protein n=1 Tax=Guyanagaster necrorhizus TaxID=856835 RepID=A0A9P8AMZ3_9AGAR|nr:uncharacterized protein BT62DRAFT_1046350 [Guyanagaster necrorhizus MCA 3950]KAG7441274.1 hypothetical protein BT62DRAFT_1046350 [Guyanagaster necrorhizus MCA 3950]